MTSFRTNKVGSLIREILSEIIVNKISDPRVSPLTSITRVEVTADLLQAKVYFSVAGQPVDERKTLAGLKHATRRIRMLLGKQLTLRHVPEIEFSIDPSIKGAAETIRILDDVGREIEEFDRKHPETDEPGTDQEQKPNGASS